MIGWAFYQDTWVYIIDKTGDQYMINWGGPTWVHESDLTDVRLVSFTA